MQPADSRSQKSLSSINTCISVRKSARLQKATAQGQLQQPFTLARYKFGGQSIDLDFETQGSEHTILVPVPLPDAFHCGKCDTRVVEHRFLKKHIATCQGHAVRLIFCCAECGERFSDLRLCNNHLQEHRIPTDSKGLVQYCRQIQKRCVPDSKDVTAAEKNDLLSDKVVDHSLLSILSTHAGSTQKVKAAPVSSLLFSVFERHGSSGGDSKRMLLPWVLNSDLVFFPVNHSNVHWSLVVLDREKGSFLHLNSIPDPSYDQNVSWYVGCIKEFEKAQLSTETLKDFPIAALHCSRQVGGVDCAIHVLKNAEAYLSSGSPSVITKADCVEWRRQFVSMAKEKRWNAKAPSIVIDPGEIVIVDQTTDSSPHGVAQPVHKGSSITMGKLSVVDIIRGMKLSGIVTRIPRVAREQASRVFSAVLAKLVVLNDVDSWLRVFLFAPFCLKKPRSGKGRKKVALSDFIRSRLVEFETCTTELLIEQTRKPGGSQGSGSSDQKTLSDQELVAAKLTCGDISGAARVLSNDDVLADGSEETSQALRDKHPSRPADFVDTGKMDLTDEVSFFTTADSVKKAIMSFPNGSSGGLDGIRPQHLKDMIGDTLGIQSVELLQNIVGLMGLAIAGKVPEEIQPLFFGARLIALKKKGGGIRPIAVGNSFRRLSSKLLVGSVRQEARGMFLPHQVGFGVSNGAEAVVHATREYMVNNINKGKVVLKVDYRNAFNSIRRDVVLAKVKEKAPWMYAYIYQAYFPSSHLIWNQSFIDSCEGVQQGDPLGPFLFNLGINDVIREIETELNAWYLDDGTMGGLHMRVLAAFEKLIGLSSQLGLEVNPGKCELLILSDDQAHIDLCFEAFCKVAPGIKNVPIEKAMLLGSSIHEGSMELLWNDQIAALRRVKERLLKIDRHEGLFLLRSCLGLPKVMYLLRTSPSFLIPSKLDEYDGLLREITESLLNVRFNDFSWDLATLPIAKGGLGLRRAIDVGLPAFLASCSASDPLKCDILGNTDITGKTMSHLMGLEYWETRGLDLDKVSSTQKTMDDHLNGIRMTNLLTQAKDNPADTALLLANGTEYSGSWLSALPVESLGLKLSNEECRHAAALRVGAQICLAYKCRCGVDTDVRGYHGLSCPQGPERNARHNAINSVIKRSLGSAHIPALVEPRGMNADDSKRPDGVTLVPWVKGKPVVWDVACVNTFCPTHLSKTSRQSGAAAADSAQRKCTKYKCLPRDCVFVPVIVETQGVWGKEGLEFVKELGRRIREVTLDPKSGVYLLERLSVAVQKGNSKCISSTFGQEMIKTV